MKQEQKKAEQPKEVALKADKAGKKAPTVAELQKMVEQLTEKLNSKPQTLEEQISFFEEKKKKINHLRKFTNTKEEIQEVLKAINENIENAQMDSEYYKLQVLHGRYGNDSIKFSIGNNNVIAAALNFVVQEIELKVAELEKQISN